VARDDDGRVVFVPFTAPGDHVRVRLTQRRTRFARGRVEALLEPSTRRTDPVCPVFGSCGGCSWQHLDYPTQVEAKARILEDAIRRVGGLEVPAPVRVVASPREYGYRSRARVLVEGGRVGFRRAQSHAICATSRCPILAEPLPARLAELFAAPGPDGERELALGADRVRVCDAAAPGPPGDRIFLEVEGERVGISPGVFSQGNSTLWGPLARAVWEAAGSGDRALEVYAGAGFLTLGLARRFARLVAIESDPMAAADLVWNLERAGLGGVEVRPETFERAAADEALRIAGPQVVVLDPPRTGLTAGAAEALAEIRAPRVVYLSCDPATLARDAARLARRGYRITHLTGFDLFPQTPHVEALAVLETDASPHPMPVG